VDNIISVVFFGSLKIKVIKAINPKKWSIRFIRLEIANKSLS
jgi:hypothetical protein